MIVVIDSLFHPNRFVESHSQQPKHLAARDAGILTLLQALPWLPLLICKISPVAFAAESVGYRYFHSFRLIRVDQSTIWEAQGQTLGILHEFLQRLLDSFGVTILRDRIDFFSYGTLALNTLVFGTVAWHLSRGLPDDWRLRLSWAATALFGIYGSWWGLFSARLPDYYTFEVTLTVACLGLFMLWLMQPYSRISPARAVALGALAGAMVGIKITLLPTALLPLLPCLMRTKGPWQQFLQWVSLWIASAVVTLAAVIVIYYQFDFEHLTQAVQAWRSFVSAPGAEPGFVSSLLHPFAVGNNPWADHRFVPVISVLWLAALAGTAHALFTDAARRREHLILGLYVLVCSGLHIWAVFKRPAETTLFETALFLSAAAAAGLTSLPARAAYQKATTLWLFLAFGWCLVSGLQHFPSAATITSMQDTSRNAWEIHDWLNATGRPVVVLLPDNRYVSGTVEETLLKGFSDVPTWNITSGYALLDAVAPRRLFVTQISDAPEGSVLVWTDVPGVAPLTDLSKTPPVVLGRTPELVRSWRMQRNDFWSRTVHAAIFPAPRDQPGTTVLKSNSAWRDSSPTNPLSGYTISPGDAVPRVELRSDHGRQVVRIIATKPTPYLALSGTIPPLPDGSGPLRMRATVRVGTARPIMWQFYDVVDALGSAETIVEPVTARPVEWISWSIQKPTTRYASPTDNFSVGIVRVQPGDWFEVAELTVLLKSGPVRSP